MFGYDTICPKLVCTIVYTGIRAPIQYRPKYIPSIPPPAFGMSYKYLFSTPLWNKSIPRYDYLKKGERIRRPMLYNHHSHLQLLHPCFHDYDCHHAGSAPPAIVDSFWLMARFTMLMRACVREWVRTGLVIEWGLQIRFLSHDIHVLAEEGPWFR